MEYSASLYSFLVVVLVYINWDYLSIYLFILIWPEIFSSEFASQYWEVKTRDEMTECKRTLSVV